MSYLVLARKYRPRNFSEMVGQSHVVQALGNALKTGRLHHAYLFTGTRGVGKTTVSRILAKSLNCIGIDGQGGITAEPCGVCEACKDIDSGRFVDYTELDAASNRGVDEIAQLLEQAVYKPVAGRFKVFMIDEVHMLTNTAFNAMLKTLEEPPEYLKFVLATTDPQKVPATVLSRCLQFNLRPMAPETIFEHLEKVLGSENISSEPQALRLLSRAARGSMRDALSLTDQAIAFGSGVLDEASVRVMLGSVDRSYVFRLLESLAHADGRRVVDISEELRLHGLSAASTLEEMATLLQRMAVLQAAPELSDADDHTDPDHAETARLAQLMPPDETQLLYSLCLHGRAELGLAPDEYAGLTMVLLRLLAFKPAAAQAPRALAAQPAVAKPEARGSAAEPTKKPLPEATPPRQVESASSTAVAEDVSVQHISDAAALAPAPVVAVDASPATDSTQDDESNKGFDHIIRAEDAIDLIASDVAGVADDIAAVVDAPPKTGELTRLADEWAKTVNQLISTDDIAALTRELGLQSELCRRDGNVWTLLIEKESLNQASAREKLQAALQALHSDQTLRLAVQLGSVSDTPAHRNAALVAARQREAEALIQNDPYVQELKREWGAKIVPGSIKSTVPSSRP